MSILDDLILAAEIENDDPYGNKYLEELLRRAIEEIRRLSK